MIELLIVDDSRIMREALIRLFKQSNQYRVFASIENAANAEIICMRNRIDLILMDVCTADDESGLVASKNIKKYYPETKIVIMTSMPEYSFIEKARDAGCNGFIYKDMGEDAILKACDEVMHDRFIWPENTPVVKIGLASSSDFTERELEILRAMVQGKSYEEIANQFFISINTVKWHIKNIQQKTGYNKSAQLIVDVISKQLILPKF